MVKYMLLTANFYLVSQVEFWKNVKVTFRKDCHLAGIQGFQSVKVLGECLSLNTWQNPAEAHAEGFSFPEGGWVPWSHGGHGYQSLSSGGDISPVRITPSDVPNHTETVGHVLLRACRQFRRLP